MKRKIGVLILLCLCALMLVFGETVKSAALDALHLWASQLVPLLFPFFICADLLRRLQGEGASAPVLFFMSMIGGAPAGAKLSGLYEDIRTRTDTAAALNMISPMYIFGAYCCGMLGEPLLSLPILLSQYLSAAFFFFLSIRRAKPLCSKHIETVFSLSSFSASIFDGVRAILSVGGTIVCFNVLLSILGSLYSLLPLPAFPPAITALAAGMLEFVNGCVLSTKASLPPSAVSALSAFIFSFGGVCVLAQSLCFAEINPLRYLCRKLLQALLAAPLAFGLCLLLLGGTECVFLPVDTELLKQNTFSALGMLFASSLSLSLLWLLQFALQKKKAARK